jgi:probable phosphoglycerate mutase
VRAANNRPTGQENTTAALSIASPLSNEFVADIATWCTAGVMASRPLLILRHGQTAWNLEGRWQGWIDVELDGEGIEQAERRARWLAAQPTTFAGVVSSPLVRAAATARIVADALGLDDVRTYPGLGERNGGDWQGLTAAEIDASWPDELAALRRGDIDAPPGGESTHELLARIDAALTAVDSEMPDGPIIVVTHGGTARAIVNRAGATEAIGIFANVGGMWIDYDRGAMVAGAPLPPLDDDPALAPGHEPVPVAPEIVASDAR